MKNLLSFAVLGIAAAGATQAHAEGAYVGAAVSAPYRGTLTQTVDGHSRSVDSDKRQFPFKLLGGYDFSSNFGVEAGYKRFGTSTYRFAPGPGNQLDVEGHAAYVAATGTLALDEQWSLLGKLGAGRRHIGAGIAGAGAYPGASSTKTDLYASAGLSYALNKNLALTLEIEHIGRARANRIELNMDSIQLGVRYGF